jgi:putative membrane-bound dehydrogenase-like protein
MRASRSVALFIVLLASAVGAQQSPDQSLARLKPAAGLEVKLWASEPMLTNPTSMAIDERGRVWVAEAVNYRRALRNQPPIREAGDRIIILEDTNQDGTADGVKVFDQNPDIRAPLGLRVLGNKVYLSQSPNLIVYTKDEQDRIVSKETLLTGFGGVDHDHGLHAINFGPDGRLYFNHGNKGFRVTDKSARTLQGSSYEPINKLDGLPALNNPDAGFFQGVALRMNEDGTDLEVLGQNFRNPFEIAVDSFGNAFQTDNDDDGNAWTRLAYVLEGGNYGFRGPGHLSWGATRSGHFHNEMAGVVPNVIRLGGGSPCGLLIYEGTLLPAKYRGQPIHAEAGRRIVGHYPLSNDGAGFSAIKEDLVYGAEDDWFRPSDVAVAPDGALFVADWYDARVGGHGMTDPQGGQGRIYRVAPPKNTPSVPALNLKTTDGLIGAFGSPSQAVRFLAHKAIVAQGADAAPMLQRLWKGNDTILRARALWILGGLPTTGPAAIQEALRDRDARFRILGLRVAQLNGADMAATSRPLLRDASPQVRREILVQLRDRDPERMIPPWGVHEQVAAPAPVLDAIAELALQYDGRDRWYLEAIGIAARGREDALYARLKAQAGNAQSPKLYQIQWALRAKSALPDLVASMNDGSKSAAERRLALEAVAEMEGPEPIRAVETFVLASTTPAELVERGFLLYSHRLFGLWIEARESPNLSAMMRKAFATPASQAAAVELAYSLGDVAYLPSLLTVARSTSADSEARAAAIDGLATTDDPKYLGDLRTLAASGPVPVRVAAIRAIANIAPDGADAWARPIVMSDAPNEVRVEALRAMARSMDGLTAILDMAEKGQLPAELRSLASNLTNNAGSGRGFGGGGRGRGGFAQPSARAGGAGAGRGAAPAAGARAGAAARGGGGGGRGTRGGRGGNTPDPAVVAIRERAAKVLPLPSATGPTLTNLATLDRNYSVSRERGQQVFNVDGGCAACHSVGGPRKAGPDLSTIGSKFGKQAMLDQIVSPSEAIAPEFLTTVLEQRNGNTVAGIVAEETPDRIVVRNAAGGEERLRPADVASRTQNRVSLMPEGLLANLTTQQVLDLLEYLDSLK